MFRWAMLSFQARYFNLYNHPNATMALVPLVDFLNHADKPSCAARGGAWAPGDAEAEIEVASGDFKVQRRWRLKESAVVSPSPVGEAMVKEV